MTRSLYICATGAKSGKSAIALGLLHQLTRLVGRVGVFRPVVDDHGPDELLDLLLSELARTDTVTTPQDPASARGVTTAHLQRDEDGAMAEIVDRYHAVASGRDCVLIAGTDFLEGMHGELALNARISANLGAGLVLVVPAGALPPEEIAASAEYAVGAARSSHGQVRAVIANQVPPDLVAETTAALTDAVEGATAVVVPQLELLRAPTVEDMRRACGGNLVHGDPELLDRETHGIVVAGMTLPHVLDRLIEGGVVVVPGDRDEVVLGVLLAHRSKTFPSLTGVVLNGGFSLPTQIERLIEGIDSTLPMIATDGGTLATAQALSAADGRITRAATRKIEAAVELVGELIDVGTLLDEPPGPADRHVVTPLMFEHQLIDGARAADAHIVLPEGAERRIIVAAGMILARRIARLTLLGDEATVRAVARDEGVDLGESEIIDPRASDLGEPFAAEYLRLRAHKGITLDQARDVVTDPSYFGTLLVHTGRVDGMVSGSVTTTAATVRPALEIVRTAPGVSVVSSVFLMCLADRVLVYGDCAINPDPSVEQLADIAISSARTAAQFGIEPRVAMLSYSTGSSGTGADVEKVRAATALVRERDPELLVEGPIQYDAAVDPYVAATKLKGSSVAGRASVLIFPDLNTGNNTYKAVQRSASAVAIGPVLQGLGAPVNDLSRGALVRDIVNTVAITAIQAGAR